jgi:hypothetical protein
MPAGVGATGLLLLGAVDVSVADGASSSLDDLELALDLSLAADEERADFEPFLCFGPASARACVDASAQRQSEIKTRLGLRSMRVTFHTCK